MSDDAPRTDPVVVQLNCEAHPSRHTIEIDRAEWDAMTRTERAVLLDSEVEVHMANSGGGGWYIADRDDEAAVGVPPRPLLVDVDEVLRLVDEYANYRMGALRKTEIPGYHDPAGARAAAAHAGAVREQIRAALTPTAKTAPEQE